MLAQAHARIVAEPVLVDPKVADRERAAVRADRQLRRRTSIGSANVPITAGLRCSVASSVPSVCGERSRLTASRASSIATIEPRLVDRLRAELSRERHAAAVVAWRVAGCSALTSATPATSDTSSSTPTASEQAAQPAVLARAPRRALGSRCDGSSRSSALSSIVVLRRPIQRGREPSAAVQLAGVATARVPVACGRGQVRVQAAADPVFLEPRAVARPLAQQRLVRELDLAVADGQQASVGQRRQHGPRAVDALELARAAPGGGRASRSRRWRAAASAPRAIRCSASPSWL